jgi:murein DD-endopeptidase MepM/ murein hydrolase activator NlpD
MPAIKRIMGDVFAAISNFIKKYIIPAWNNVLLPAIQKLWGVVKAVIPIVKNIFKALFSAIRFYVTKIFIPIWKTIFSVIRALFPVVKKIFGAVKAVVSGVFKFIGFIWKNVLAPVFRGIGKALGVMGGVFKTVFTKVKDIFSGFKTAFSKLWDFIKGLIDKIKNAFGTVKDAIGNAFSNLGGAVRGGLNTFINFLNDKLIGPLSSVTSKFGLTIPDIKTFATGGKVTGPGSATSDSIAARLSNGEFVVKTQAAKALGYKNLEYMNKTGQIPSDGVGGLIGWAKDAISDGVGAIADGAEYIGKKGAGKVLSALVNVAKDAVSGLGLSNTSFIKDFALGILEKLADAAANWGGDKGKTPPPSVYGPYANTAGLPNIQGWSYPLAQRFPITQYPNQGHSPSWAVDIGAPTGVPVIAVAAGVVKSIIDKGATSYGKYIEIAHADGTTSLYAHLNEFLVLLGKRVAAGDIIGRSGHSGGVRSSTGGDGSHLHFELKPGSDSRAMMRLRGVMLAKGGVARATNGGVPAIIAEAGRDERVEPLDRDGMSKRDKAIIRAVSAAAGGKGSMTINVNNPEPERASTSVAKAVRSRAISSGWSV